MSTRCLGPCTVLARAMSVVAAVALAPLAPGAAQTPTAVPASSPSVWTAPRTPDGHPNLQGYWTNISFTPFERPAEFAGRELMTEAELADFFKREVQKSYDLTRGHPAGTAAYDATQWGLDTWQLGVKPSLRTSVVIDPPDGKIPPLMPAAAARRAAEVSNRPAPGEGYFWNGWQRYPDSVKDAETGLRCLFHGGGSAPLVSNSYNSMYLIVQSRSHIAILYERGALRLIPLDRSPHFPGQLRQWYGDSRGWWDGDTLVIETTNFNDQMNFRGANVHLRVTERLTRMDAGTIRYQFTIDDPTVWTRPWSGELPFVKVDGPMFEYACHEGNRGLTNVLSAARAEERPAAGDAVNKGGAK